jgi:hypothetical protein
MHCYPAMAEGLQQLAWYCHNKSIRPSLPYLIEPIKNFDLDIGLDPTIT